MAIYDAGYLSPIRKKLGNAVGRKWRTLDVLAVYRKTIRNPKTLPQRLVRARFSALATMSMQCDQAIQMGYTVRCTGTPVPPRSQFIGTNWAMSSASESNGVISTTLDYEDMFLAVGSLPAVNIGTLDATTARTLVIPLNDSASVGQVSSDDKVYMVAYCPELGVCALSSDGKRTDEEISMMVPSSWVGKRVHVYVLTIGHGTNNNGQDNEGKVANSVYGGSATVA